MPATVQAVHVGRHLEDVEDVALEAGDAFAFSTPCPVKASGKNEDAAVLIGVDPDTLVLAVADGLGGHPAGERASELALAEIERAVRGNGGGPDASDEAILAGFGRANDEVRGLGVGAATTLVAVVVRAGVVRSFHVGDSGALIFGGRGRVKLQTAWHSPVGYALRAGLIDEEEAMFHDDRHLISNVVGDEAMQIEVGPEVRLAPRDTIVVATDGLFDNLTTAEIVTGLVGRGLGGRTRELVSLCRARMQGRADDHPSKPDDLTLVAWRPARRGS